LLIIKPKFDSEGRSTEDVVSLTTLLRLTQLSLQSVGQNLRSFMMEPYSSRRKGCCVRQENACLTMQDEQLIGELDAMHYGLAPSKSQILIQGSRVEGKNRVAVMSEQIRQLQTKLETQATELKTAELRADCSQEAAAHGDILVASLTEQLSTLREALENNTALCKRAEQQRNQALQNAEKLKEAFKEYKATISIKLTRVMENESKLKEILVDCDREKEDLQMKCTELEKGKVEQNQTISQLKEEVKCAAGLQAQLEEAGQKVVHLERQLVERGAEFRELASLRKELENLRTLTRSQEQKVSQSQGEAQQSQAELASLEAILSLLHLREGAVGTLCVRPCMFPPVNYLGTAHLLKLKPGEGYQQLLRVLQSMETERTKQDGLVQRLQERLSRTQEEISSLQSSMSQRASHYQSLHTELLDKVSQATDTEKELKRKSARVASLEKQLQEKSSAYSQAALTNTELDKQLLEKSSTLQHYQSLMTKKQREYQQSLDKLKKSQSQQLTEQQHRMEMLQQAVEEAQSRRLALEQELSSLHRERDHAQDAALLLQSSIDQLAQQRQDEVRHNEVLLESFTEQAAQSAAKVSELQSSLSACREELNSYLQQMDEMKKNYESELQSSKYKVSSLQEKLQGANLVCQNSSEQNLQLQLSLQHQQTMLTESTAHISELEESQSQLQKQVSSLEQQLERARATLQGEVRNRERDGRERDQNLQEMNQQNKQLSESVSHLTSEITKCRGELVSKDSELQCLRKDVNDKTSHISSLGESLQHTKRQLDSKSDTLMDLGEKLRCCEADRLNCAQRAQMLEGQLQAVQRELAETLEQLRELRDVLQTTQTIADERQASVEKLTVRLSETQRELEERTHEVLDMDNALKERQGELQKRAELLRHLEVAIRDHKQEMERKVDSLQQNLQARESELRDAQRELTDRTKGQHALDQQLCVCQQKLHTSLQKLEETQRHCEALTGELDATKLQTKEKEVRLDGVEEELALKEARWLQLEAELQSIVTSLELELDLEKEQHSKELESLQQTRGQLLKVSEQISSTMLSSQEQLAAKLQQSQNQLEEAKTQLEQTKARLNRTRNEASHLQTQRDQSRTQLEQSKTQLEQSRILCEQTRAQNSQLHSQLEKLSTQLIQANMQVGQLQTHLQASKKSVEMSNESLLIKESEATRLQARISCLERAADRDHLYTHKVSLAAPHTFTHSLESSSSAHWPPASPHKLQTTPPSILAQSTRPPSPTRTRACSSPPAHSYLQPVSSSHQSHQSESQRTCDWLQRSSGDSSLELSQSLKATLREALGRSPWESSSPSFSDTEDHSWQGLNDMEATETPDRSFNPLTYRVEKREHVNPDMEAASTQDSDDEQRSESRRESVCTLVGQEEEEADMSSLTGMLRFVNQTLAMQEDPSLWNATGSSQTGRIFTLQASLSLLLLSSNRCSSEQTHEHTEPAVFSRTRVITGAPVNIYASNAI
ncbi:coiled-coil domain-containing protein 18, partial [Pungitius pungitius]|uniref:coiled-coil domain-containing protein 18 n=1 Tax=Pungitius pungitius TaxID=134920 RepID=UPI002E117131